MSAGHSVRHLSIAARVSAGVSGLVHCRAQESGWIPTGAFVQAASSKTGDSQSRNQSKLSMCLDRL